MGCNCKTQTEQYSVESDVKLNKKIINYTLRSVVFLFSLILLPIILVASIWIIFRTIVLNKEINVFEILNSLGNLLKSNKNDDDDDDNYEIEEEYDIDDYELMDVDYITNKTN